MYVAATFGLRVTAMRQAVLLAIVVLLAACAGREVLIPKSAAVPSGLDLSGEWQLSADTSATNRELADAEYEAAGGLEDLLGERPPQRSRRDRRALVHVFLETGTRLRITQTDAGLFISFDRAIVEEYRFGEHRAVNVGPVVAERVSGWEEDGYVIETLDSEGGKLVERYSLFPDSRTLVRRIAIYDGDDIETSVTQRFTKL